MAITKNFDPVFHVTIFPAKADGGGQINVSERILSMSYEDHEAQIDKLTLDVDNFDLSNFDAPVWKAGNKLEVSWGYDGATSPPRTLRIQKVTGGQQLKVEALDQGCLMNRNHVIKSWPNMKRSDVAKAIASANGYGDAEQFIDDTTEVLTMISQARMTDAQLCKDMARREGLEFYIDFDGFHFHKRKLGQRPLRTFTFYTDPGQGDILSFNVENDLYTRQAGGMTAKVVDPKTKAISECNADNATCTDQTNLAPDKVIITGIAKRDGTATGDFVKDTGSSVINRSTEKTKDAATRKVQGAFNKSQMNAAIIVFEAKGDPSMIAKIVVTINGIGKTLSGNYYVVNVTHKLGAQGYTISVKAKRDGRSAPNNAAAYGEAAGKNAAGKGVNAGGAQNSGGAGGTSPGGTSPNDLLTPIQRRDGSVGFTDTRGRSQQDAPFSPGDLFTQNQSDSGQNGKR